MRKRPYQAIGKELTEAGLIRVTVTMSLNTGERSSDGLTALIVGGAVRNSAVGCKQPIFLSIYDLHAKDSAIHQGFPLIFLS
jgi:hypothetical protein